ncbi:MAG TPA: hypothetical protein VL128_13990 [Candidatus Eisenbacteria bacterium]|nr:hypothetical protein [Candidatus Eisenbacteria bacterium]
MYARLNLATRPLISERRFFAATATLGALGLVLLVVLGWRFHTVRQQDANFRARSGRVEQEMAKVSQQRSDLEKYFAQQQAAGFQENAKFVVGVLEARSINWTQMFMDLEKTLPPGVHVLHIEPKLENGVVSVHFVVGAMNQEAKLKLLRAFENSPAFARVEVLSEHTETRAGADPLTIEFEAEYPNS